MSLPVDFHQAVRDEIDDLHGWDEQRRFGLENVFFGEVQQLAITLLISTRHRVTTPREIGRTSFWCPKA